MSGRTLLWASGSALRVAVAAAVALAAAATVAHADGAGAPTATATAEVQPLPVPETFKAYPAPSDDATHIGIEWPPAKGERPSAEDLIYISPKPDGPFKIASRAPSTGSWKRDYLDVFGESAGGSADHYAGVAPAEIYPVDAFLVAVLGAKAAATGDDEAKKAVEGNARELLAGLYPADEQAAVRTETEKLDLEALLGRLRDRLDALFGKEALVDVERFLRSHRFGKIDDLSESRKDDLQRELIDRPFYFRFAVAENGRRAFVEKAPGEPLVVEARVADSWFRWAKLNNLVIMVLLTITVLGFIRHARRNPNLFLRRIGGLDAVDEALGRATEMGKPVLFVHGIATMGEISTIAAVNILGEMSKKVAKYDSRLLVTNNDPVVLAVSQETVKEGYLHAGRPDAYNPDDVFFVSAEQFSYVAAIDGIMMRQKPAANFFMGYFYAESLLLSETGATTGAIQIAATDAYTQLPFFITTCDYTLMGEELYAASAYLSRDPLLVGSLKGQDIGKGAVIVIALAGTILASFGIHWVSNLVKAL